MLTLGADIEYAPGSLTRYSLVGCAVPEPCNRNAGSQYTPQWWSAEHDGMGDLR